MNSLNATSSGKSIFGKTTILHPQTICQFLYCLSPTEKLSSDLKLLSGATNIGKLDIVWRSNLGERGRLQTSQLQRMVRNIVYSLLLKSEYFLYFRAQSMGTLECLS